ncbi:MAG: PAS domain S-box protein, partial [Leptolyngbya sp.]|nr:PAS domain S-box protein [Candidatus Melainabacteria bacterium]
MPIKTFSRLPILQQGLIIVLLPVGLQLLIIASLYTLQNEAETEAARADRSRFIVQTANQICLDIYNGILQARESLTEGRINEGYKHIAKMANTATANITSLKEVVASDADQYDALISVEKRLEFIRDGLISTRKLAISGDLDGSVESGKKITLQARRDSKEMIETMMSLVTKEREISENSPQKLEILRERIRQGLLIAIFADVALACGLVAVFGNTIGSRLKHLQENSFRFATDKPLLEPLQGSDEIAQVDKRFREMANALTELRRKESALVENASEVICSVDKDMKFSAVNHACETIWGYSPEELLGTRLAQIVQPEFVDKTIAAMEEIKGASEVRHLENRIMRKNTESCDFSWSIQWSEAERSYFCVAHDITERKELERLKKEFVDMVSHDLRAPLFSIQAFHQMLDSGVYGNLS